jgi:hypothetical protein
MSAQVTLPKGYEIAHIKAACDQLGLALVDPIVALAPLVRCVGCKQPTMGSLGATGNFWRTVCQTCKDEADDALLTEIKLLGEALREYGNHPRLG